MAVNELALVRDSRNTPATDSITAAPPSLASAEPATVTSTRPVVKRLVRCEASTRCRSATWATRRHAQQRG